MAEVKRIPPRLVISAESERFDPITIRNWQEEGFVVSYLPLPHGQDDLASALTALSAAPDHAGGYALIAYGAAASAALSAATRPLKTLKALICYYPTVFPSASIPNDTKILLHLAADSDLPPATHKTFKYPDTKTGFAESGSPNFDLISTRLAWSRSLAVVKKAFDIENDLEAIWEEHLALEFATKDAAATMKTMVAEPYVNHIPTMTGGIGAKELFRFYNDYFIPSNPPSMSMKLLSRTIGVDRVVDELYFKFRHTTEIPWLLPGVKPTGKEVEFMLVSIVCIRGTKLYHEHIYWDQATVLAQIGLIDATNLPVVGAEAARKVIDETTERVLRPGARLK